jgi:hypothetical protein
MILIDTLMRQSDRTSGGNISASAEVIYRDGADYKTRKSVKNVAADLPQFTVQRSKAAPGRQRLRAGRGAGQFVKRKYLGKLNHMHPRTYVRLIKFASKWENDPSVKAFFQTEALFLPRQISSFEAILLKSRDVLREKCKASDHFLDLDIDDYFNGKAPDIALSDADSPPMRA